MQICLTKHTFTFTLAKARSAASSAQLQEIYMSLGAGTYSPFDISLRDKGGEVGTLGLYGILQTAETFAANNTLAAAFKGAIVNAVLGQVIQWSYGGITTIVNPSGKASSSSAQRENKLLIRYHDVTTLKVLTATIPTINLPNLVFLTDANDFVSLASPSFMSGLVTAWEAFISNPETGNLTVIDSAEYVGRNR